MEGNLMQIDADTWRQLVRDNDLLRQQLADANERATKAEAERDLAVADNAALVTAIVEHCDYLDRSCWGTRCGICGALKSGQHYDNCIVIKPHPGAARAEELKRLTELAAKLPKTADGVSIPRAGTPVWIVVAEDEHGWVSPDMWADPGIYEYEFVREDDGIWGLLPKGGTDIDYWQGAVYSSLAEAAKAKEKEHG
jgi:hypothetical protein